MELLTKINQRLAELEAAHLLREEQVVALTEGPYVQVEGRRLLSLASNNYLGLTQDPDLNQAACEAITRWGLGSGGSRALCGTTEAHRRTEHAFARFVGAERAMHFNTAYAANTGVLPVLCGAGDVICSDALNHASLIDGCRLSRARTAVYPHLDLAALEDLLKRVDAEKGAQGNLWVVTESVFSMDGDSADLKTLRGLCDRYGAALFVDEAHALGVFGAQGRGLCAEQGVQADVSVYGLGKAFGLCGAFVCGASPLVQLLRSTARPYLFTTAAPAAWLEIIEKVIERVARADAARFRVKAHAAYMRESLKAAGFHVKTGSSPIVPLLIGDNEKVLEIKQRALLEGLWLQAIRPPTVAPGTARLRLVPTAAHSESDIERAVDILAKLKR